MYQETLEAQWQNLCSDFALEYERLTAQGKGIAAFAAWYETRIHRWESVAYPEGIILGQTENEALSQALTDAMKAFRFADVEPQAVRPLWQGIAAALAAGLASSGLIALLHWPAWRVILSGMVVCGVVFSAFWKTRQSDCEKEARRVKEAYVGQLRDYGTELQAICQENEVTGEDEDNVENN